MPERRRAYYLAAVEDRPPPAAPPLPRCAPRPLYGATAIGRFLGLKCPLGQRAQPERRRA